MRLLFINLLLIVISLNINQTSQDQWNTKDFFRREHSLSKPYGGSGSVPFWDFVGSTVVSNKYVRLTADAKSLKGALWNSVPLQLTDWEMQVQFKVHGHGRELNGDGFSIWYARDRMQIGDVFGSKDYFMGLAIILDTYNNHNGAHNHGHPYISAMVNNGSLHYDHDRDGTHTELAGCESQFRNKDFDTYVAIRYQNYKLTVSTDTENKNTWKECFSVNRVKLPTHYYFGFSAATGDLSDNHDIISVKVYELESDRKKETIDHAAIFPEAETFAPPRDHVDDPPTSSWGFFRILGLVILIIFCLGCLGFGIYWFVRRQTHTKKRFY